MNTIMKRIAEYLSAAAFAFIAICSFDAAAQGPQGGMNNQQNGPGQGREFRSADPDEIARREADRLNKSLNLTQKQYKKIYRFCYNEIVNRMDSGMPMGPRPGGPGMGPGMGPGGPGMGPGGPGMGPGGNRPRLSEEEMQQRMEENAKAMARKDKKFRKILDPVQYGMWVKMEQERRMNRHNPGNNRPENHR